MANSNLSIIVSAKDLASGQLRLIQGNIKGIDQAAGFASKGIGGLESAARLAGAGGLAALAVGAGKAALDLGKLGEQGEQAERRLTAFAGSGGKATDTISAIARASDGGLSKMEAMATGSRLLSMGLANTAAEAGQLSRMAMMLGDSTASAGDRINDFSLMLANQSMLRLDQFGISSGQVKQRIDELKAADANLTQEQAFLNAVMEIGGQRMAQLEQAGVKAASSSDKLASSWANLKLIVGEGLAPTVTAGLDLLTKAIDSLDSHLSGTTAALNEYSRAFDIYKLAVQQVAQAEQGLQAALAMGDAQQIAIRQSALDVANERRNMAQATYEAAQQEAGLAYSGNQLKDAANGAAGAVAGAGNAAATAGAQSAAAVGGVVALANAYFYLNRAQNAPVGRDDQDRREGILLGNVTANQPYDDRDFQDYGTVMQEIWQPVTDRRIDAERSIKEAAIRAQTIAAKTAGAAYTKEMSAAAKAAEQAMNQAASKINSAFATAAGNAKQLFDLTGGDSSEAGKNGPFEKLYRGLDFAKLGDESPWAKEFEGMSQEAVAAMAAKAQKGLWTPDVVKAFVNVDQLVAQVQEQQIAERLQAALSEQIAAKAQVTPDAVQRVLGIKDGDYSGTAKAIASGITTAIPGQEAQFKVAGKTLWAGMEKGIIEQATQSGALNRAVSAAVAAALVGVLQ